MEKKDLLSNNRIIAAFMNSWTMELSEGWIGKELKYHSSWSHLMPVIEKISSIKYSDEDGNGANTSYPRTFGMINEEGLFMFRFNRYPLFEHSQLITAAYFAVLNYIKHYNTLNQ